ncbi:MAG: NAD-dependent epimerase/dehydratase family protein [Candidatus Promineifilaceae bacterium]|jgi:dihydroflavonol-4-reductase
MKAFVTGGSGFIGRNLIIKLLDLGWQVTALVRSPGSAADLTALGANVAYGDVIDMDSMREPMRGCDVVFHLAAIVEMGDPDPELMEKVNVGGTRKVLRLARELRIPRIIFTSTVSVFGDTHGELVDESYEADARNLTEHARTKWLAHYKVAMPLLEKGAPIIIVVPGGVYGPGGHGLVTDLMRIFYRGYPLLSGADTVLTFAHVDDIAEGHVRAAEKGRIGETYILSGPAVPLGDMLDFWSYLTGIKSPGIRLPASVVHRSAPLLSLLGRMTGLRSAFSREGAQIAGATIIARSDKAREKLGWQTRPLQNGMLETLDWIAASERERHEHLRQRERQFGLLIFPAAAVLTAGWLLSRRRK